MSETVTIEQANKRLEEHLKKAQSVFPEGVRFEVFANHENSPCEDPGESVQGRQFASKIYQAVNLPADGVKDQFTRLKRWWTSNGYEVVGEEDDVLRVVSTADEYKFALRTNPNHDLYLIGDTPCVWPNGTPQPEE